MDHPIALQYEPIELGGLQRADDGIPLPPGKCVAPVNDEARHRRGGGQVEHRLLDGLKVELDAQVLSVLDRRAVVVHALRGERPAVVPAR